MTETTVLVGIACGLAGFGLSELLAVVKLSGKVAVHESKIDGLEKTGTETVELLKSIVNQNTQMIAHLSIDNSLAK